MKRIFWQIYGLLFYRHWCRFTQKMSWRKWWSKLLNRFSYSKKLWKRCIWWLLEPYWPGMTCPNCGYRDFDFYEKPYFVCLDSGTSYVPGEPTTHWFRGIQSCPRCSYKWDVEDSD